MRSIYCVQCTCGYQIETEHKEAKCPRCNRAIQLDWPAEYVGPSSTEKTGTSDQTKAPEQGVAA
jgi:phage FluMu protein Com